MKQHGGLLNRHGVGLKYNTSRDIVFCKGRYSYSRYQGYLRSMLITITVAVSEYSQSLYLKYERTGAHFFSYEYSFTATIYSVADLGISKPRCGPGAVELWVRGLFWCPFTHTLRFYFGENCKKKLSIVCGLQLK